MSEYAKPLWPMPEGWKKPTIRIMRRNKERPFHVHLPDITGGGWEPNGFETLEDALDFVQFEAHMSTLSTEYVERREALAEFLCDLVYGKGMWSENSDPELRLNYRLDADEIIKANPHLLSLGERERLAGQIPELAYHFLPAQKGER